MRKVILGMIVGALFVGNVAGLDAVAMVHGNPNLGGPPVYGVVVPALPGGAYQ